MHDTKEVLITGGAGFIGSRLAADLERLGHHVTVADVLHPQVHDRPGRPAMLPGGVALLPVDVTSATGWQAILHLSRPDVIVHLAAETGTGQSLTEATRHGSVNVVGTTRMLDALTIAGHVPEHLVLASSRAVYGEGPWEPITGGPTVYPPPRRHEDLVAGRWNPTDGDGQKLRAVPARAATTAPNPTNVYAATKLAQEHIGRAWCAATGTSFSVLRLQNVYGAGQSPRNAYTGILTLFARLAVTGAELRVFEDGSIIRDFVHVGDVVRALTAAIGAPPRTSRVLDIGSGTPITVERAARRIAEVTGAPPPVVTGEFRDGDVRAASCDLRDAGRDLGWTPNTNFEEGVVELTEWMRGVL